MMIVVHQLCQHQRQQFFRVIIQVSIVRTNVCKWNTCAELQAEMRWIPVECTCVLWTIRQLLRTKPLIQLFTITNPKPVAHSEFSSSELVRGHKSHVKSVPFRFFKIRGKDR